MEHRFVNSHILQEKYGTRYSIPSHNNQMRNPDIPIWTRLGLTKEEYDVKYKPDFQAEQKSTEQETTEPTIQEPIITSPEIINELDV